MTFEEGAIYQYTAEYRCFINREIIKRIEKGQRFPHCPGCMTHLTKWEIVPGTSESQVSS